MASDKANAIAGWWETLLITWSAWLPLEDDTYNALHKSYLDRVKPTFGMAWSFRGALADTADKLLSIYPRGYQVGGRSICRPDPVVLEAAKTAGYDPDGFEFLLPRGCGTKWTDGTIFVGTYRRGYEILKVPASNSKASPAV